MEWNRFSADTVRPSQARPGNTSRRPGARRAAIPLVALSVGLTALTGCGGGGGLSGGSAHVRAVNASPNGGQATVYFNGTNYNGTLGFSLNSVYLNLDSGADTFTFTLTGSPSKTYTGTTQTLSNGGYYSAVVFGRSDITTATDPRAPRLVVLSDDVTTPPAGDTRLRVVQAAPDAPNVDLLIDGQVVAGNVSYATAGGYLDLAGGSHTFQINQAGTATVLAPAQTLTPQAGLVYSLYVLEATVTPAPTYTFELIGDAR